MKSLLTGLQAGRVEDLSYKDSRNGIKQCLQQGISDPCLGFYLRYTGWV